MMAGDKGTVYLSKSNRSDPDRVSRVRKWLRSKGFTVLEHEGGDYDPSLLLKAHYMVMVGVYKHPVRSGYVLVGKGQYNQVKERRNYAYLDNFYVSNLLYGNPVLRKVQHDQIEDENNWTTSFGYLKVNSDTTVRLNNVVKEPMTRTTDPMTMEAVERMEEELPDEYKIAEGTSGNEYLYVHPIHLACITLLQ